MNIRTFVAYLSQNTQHDFPKMRGGGAKGRLELFRSFIRFGVPIRPFGIMESCYKEMCMDILRERKRMGGDWAIATALIDRQIRDYIR